MSTYKQIFTKDLLAKLARGISKTYIAPVTSGSVSFSSTTFASAGLLYSIEGSLAIDWAEPSISEIRVDQGLQTIAMDIEKGEVTFSANYPTMAGAALAEFFEQVGSSNFSVATPDTVPVAYSGPGFTLEPKTTEVSVMITDMDEKFAICMARVSLTARIAYDSDNKIWYIGLNGRVLANLATNQPDVVISEKVA
jgi:hypothetical protein